MAEMGFEPIASDIFSRIRKPGNASHLARPAEGCPPQGIYKERLLQVLAGKLGWPVTILRKPWGPKAEFPQQSLTSRYLCLRINSTVDPWVPQESPSSLSLSSLICTMEPLQFPYLLKKADPLLKTQEDAPHFSPGVRPEARQEGKMPHLHTLYS